MARTRTRPFSALLACCLACLGAPTAMGFTTAVRQSPQSPGFFRRSGVAMNANPLLKVASRGMGLIKPLFVAEAQIQSAVRVVFLWTRFRCLATFEVRGVPPPKFNFRWNIYKCIVCRKLESEWQG